MYPNDMGTPPAAANPYEQNLQAVKQFLRRPLTLVICLLFTVTSIWSIVTQILSLIETKQEMGFWGGPIIDEATYSSMLSGTIISAVVLVLLMLGFWLTYLKSRSDNPFVTPNGGLGILFALAIVMIVLAALVSVGLLIAFAFAGAASADIGGFFDDAFGYNYYYTANVTLGMIFLLLALLVVFLLCFAIGWLRLVNSLKSARSKLFLSTGGTLLFGVTCIIVVVFAILGLIGEISAASQYGQQLDIVALIPVILGCIELILLAVFSFSYRSYAGEVNRNLTPAYPAAPAYPTAPVYAQPNMYANPGYYPPSGPQNGYAPYAAPQNSYTAAPPAETYDKPQAASGTYAAYSQPEPPAPVPEEPAVPEQPAPEPEIPAEEPEAAPAEQCSYCGKEVRAEDQFCPYCGNRIYRF